MAKAMPRKSSISRRRSALGEPLDTLIEVCEIERPGADAELRRIGLEVDRHLRPADPDLLDHRVAKAAVAQIVAPRRARQEHDADTDQGQRSAGPPR